jgi:hypothetical protein
MSAFLDAAAPVYIAVLLGGLYLRDARVRVLVRPIR